LSDTSSTSLADRIDGATAWDETPPSLAAQQLSAALRGTEPPDRLVLHRPGKPLLG
jgi:hypothetical protein